MAELQISVVTNDTHRSQIVAQIRHWEDTLERLFCEQFRLRCYMASLQNGELPNPKGVLQKVNQVCYCLYFLKLSLFTFFKFGLYINNKILYYISFLQSTKAVLNLLGVFTVSSFHAFICARSPSLLSNLLAG